MYRVRSLAKLRNEIRGESIDPASISLIRGIALIGVPPIGEGDELLTRKFIVANVAPVHLAIFAPAKLFPG